MSACNGTPCLSQTNVYLQNSDEARYFWQPVRQHPLSCRPSVLWEEVTRLLSFSNGGIRREVVLGPALPLSPFPEPTGSRLDAKAQEGRMAGMVRMAKLISLKFCKAVGPKQPCSGCL